MNGLIMKCIVLTGGILFGVSYATTIDVDNDIQSYTSLSNTTVNLTGRSELRLTSSTSPLTNCQINLNSNGAWLFLLGLWPSAVNTSTYLSQIYVNGAPAVLDSNIRIVQYGNGAVVIPHGPNYTPLAVYRGGHFVGNPMNLGLYTYYRPAQLGAMNNAIRSFRLKRGYMATFAQESDGTGASRVFIADEEDLEIGVMPADLDKAVSFVRVFPWGWPTQKGWSGGNQNQAATLNSSWNYGWNASGNSTLDIEYVPMRHNRWWPSYTEINNKQNSTHVLGFNEPDQADQADMTVAQAIAQWPNLLASGLRLGSPAPTDGGLNWLYAFMDHADALNYRVDFVAVHYYKNNWTASQMENWLWNIHQRTKRPLWITEFNNGCNWTSPHPTYQQNATKINELITRLASLPYVERYSIYSWCTNREMFYSDGSLTPAGIVYRDHVSPMAIARDLNEECIGYYRLDEAVGTTAYDFSGRQRHGTLKNGLSFDTDSVPGVHGYALQFDGVNDYIELPEGFSRLDNGFSVSLWARPTAVKSWSRFIDFGRGAGNHNIYLARRSSSNDLIFSVYSGGSWSHLTAVDVIQNDQWQFFAATVDLVGNAVIYKNGHPVASGSISRPANINRTHNYIGRSNWSADAYYQGQMDDIRVFDYAMRANEVAALYAMQSDESGPFTGSPETIPGRIRAEDFDLGGLGVSYHDSTPGNSGGAYRPDEDVDIRAINDYGSGYAITDIAAGEWLQYTVDITETAEYCLYFRASAIADDTPVTVMLNEEPLATVMVDSTGSLDDFQTFVVNDIALTAGEGQLLRLEFVSGDLEVNWIQFEKQGPWGGTPHTLPGRIYAKKYDIGGPGRAYYDTTIGNTGGTFRFYEHVDIADINDSGAGFAIDNIESGEWLRYTVNSTAAQADVHARVASTKAGGQILVRLDGDLLATIDVPDTGSLETWQTVSAPFLPLPDSENSTLTLEFVGTGFRLNWISFANQIPYPQGTPHAIPGRMEFEDFDLGGPYIAYFDNTVQNVYGAYRPQEFVDIVSIDGNGFAVYASASPLPEWLEYTCQIAPGTYTVVIRHASGFAPQQLTLSVGTETLATFALPNTVWGFQETGISNVVLPGGEHILRFTMANSTAMLDYVDFIRQYHPADLTQSGQVDMDDFVILAAQWMGVPGQPSADIAPQPDGDGIVDFFDLLMLAENWLIMK